MERKLASIQRVDALNPIEGADKIEVASIEGWKVVTQKGIHKVGDLVVYFEIDSFLPLIPLYEFLLRGNSPKKMLVDGKEIEGIRLKTIKLRGQLSQGIILPFSAFTVDWAGMPLDLNSYNDGVGTDVTELLGILKYEAPVATEMMGKAKGNFPGFIPKTDEERIQNMKEVLTSFYVTEKLDGSSVTYYKKDGKFGVCSRNLELVEGDSTQWKIARELNLEEKLPDGMAIQGEIIGEGIQKNPYKIKGHKVFFFNIYTIEGGKYLDFGSCMHFVDELGIPWVPVLAVAYQLPKTVDEILTYAEGRSQLNPDVEREGVVVRPKVEMTYRGQRLSFKVISNKYLLEE